MRIGILALLHESNTFISQPTCWNSFCEDLLVEGQELVSRLQNSHHEVGGFLGFLQAEATRRPVTILPLLAARALPAGPIESQTFQQLLTRILESIERNWPLDGLLIAAHGAAVSQSYPDADGFWLTQVRQRVGKIPMIVTLDPHANLSPAMVRACDALIAYRTNPHLDQRQRGEEAARLLVAMLDGSVRPTMAARFPPLVINIERQSTGGSPLKEIFDVADSQLQSPKVISNSVILGFPYSDVAEMGAAIIVVTDHDQPLAERLAEELNNRLWAARQQLIGVLQDVDEVLDVCQAKPSLRFCLLDMGDNVGGGSSADGTWIAQALLRRQIGPSFACLKDDQAVASCFAAGVGSTLRLEVGGKTDSHHGSPLSIEARVQSLHQGLFEETQPRHGGITKFDQGPTAVVQVAMQDGEMTLMLTSKRMVPFSLKQLTSFGIDPLAYRILVAKGVHAPIAAYRDVCDELIRVNTRGSTCADLNQLTFKNRRQPLFPFEEIF
jgi:microcystin degradation protein MlrC